MRWKNTFALLVVTLLSLAAVETGASAQSGRDRAVRPGGGAAGAGGGAKGGDLARAAALRSFRTRHYEVFTDLPESEARPFAQHMDLVYSEYAKRLKAFPQRDSKLVRLYVFSSEEQYLLGLSSKGFNALNTAGIFFRTFDETGLAIFVRGYERRRMLQTLQHEGFHQFAHQRIGDTMPMWANEGLAEYFGEGLLLGRTMQTGLAPASRILRVREAINSGDIFSFEEMLTMTNAQWNARVSAGDRRAAVMYDQAWSMAHFLVHANGGRYAGPFEQYLMALGQGKTPEQAFEQAFKTKDFKAFERLWTRYMSETIEPDPVSTAEERLGFMAEGIRILHANRVELGSVGALQAELKRCGFQVTRTSHSVVQVYHASDDELFRAPRPENPRASSSIELVRSRDRSMPPGVLIKGLRVTVELVWERGPDGEPVHDVIFY